MLYLCFQENLTDEVDQSLNWKCMPLFWSFDHHSSTNDLGHRRNIKEQRFRRSREQKDRSSGEHSFEFIERFLSLDGLGKALSFLQEPV